MRLPTYVYYMQVPVASKLQNTGHNHLQTDDLLHSVTADKCQIYVLICFNNMEGFVRHYQTILTHILPCPCTDPVPAETDIFV
jgi:hypothetical protein